MSSKGPEAVQVRKGLRARVTTPSMPTRLGRYALVGELGSGGMARVYLARAEGALGFERLVAVKVMHRRLCRDMPEVADMFFDEARIGACLRHPNICAVLDFGESDGVRFIVLQYLSGQPLSACLRRLHGRPGHRGAPGFPALAARLMAEVCEGLHGAHEACDEAGLPLGVVHRDVAPDNVFVTYDGSVKVMDFGIARADRRVHATVAGAFKGKIAYAAPERFVASVDDRRGDIWSAGVVLWELLTGHALFARAEIGETMGAVVEAPIVPPSVLGDAGSPELDAVVMRALARDPEERWQSGREMANALNQAALAQGYHIGTAELAEWLQSLFPEEEREAREVERAVHAIEVGRPAMVESGERVVPESRDHATPAPRRPPHVASPDTAARDARDGTTSAAGGPVAGSSPVAEAEAEPETPLTASDPACPPDAPPSWTMLELDALTGDGAGDLPATVLAADLPAASKATGRPRRSAGRRVPGALLRLIGLAVALGTGAFLADPGDGAGHSTPASPSVEVAEPSGDAEPESPEAAVDPLDTPMEASPPTPPEDILDAPQSPAEVRSAARGGRPDRRGSRRGARAEWAGRPSASGATGTVHVVATGGWADVYHRSERVGRTPGRIVLPAGRQILTFRSPRHEPRIVAVHVPGGGRTQVSVALGVASAGAPERASEQDERGP